MTFRSILLAVVLAVAVPFAAVADPVNRIPVTAAASTPLELTIDSPNGFGVVYTTDGAGDTVGIALPDCAAAPSVTSAPFEPKRGALGLVFVIAATTKAVEVSTVKDDDVFGLPTPTDAGDEVDLAVGEVGIFLCLVPGTWSVIAPGGEDGGAS